MLEREVTLINDQNLDYNIVTLPLKGRVMKLEKGVKPISYFKAHASEVINDVVDNQETMIITQNGEAKVILQDIHSYEQMQDSLAMLKILALSNADIKEGRISDAEEAFSDMEREFQMRHKN